MLYFHCCFLSKTLGITYLKFVYVMKCLQLHDYMFSKTCYNSYVLYVYMFQYLKLFITILQAYC